MKKKSIIGLLAHFLKDNMSVVRVTVALYLIDCIVFILLPLFQQVYTDNVITKKNPEWFTPLMLSYAGLLVLELLTWLVVNSQRKKHVSSLLATVSSRYIWTLLRMPMSLVDRFSSGELAARYGSISSAVNRIEADLPVLVLWIQPVICTWLLLYYNVKLALFELAIMVMLLVSIRLNVFVQKKLSRKMAASDGHIQSVTMNGLDNIETIKSVGGEQTFYCTWDKVYSEAFNDRVNTTTAMILMKAIPDIMYWISDIMLLSLGGWYILQGELTPGMLIAMQGMMANMVYPLGKIMTVSQKITQTHSSLERVEEVTDCAEEEGFGDIQLMNPDELPDRFKLTGDIELRNVTFGYTHEQSPILKNFSLSIKAGQQVAFVGFSGCGKSTIAKLLSGLYDPWEGEVLYDGVPRQQINRMLFVNSVSVVNQDIILFEGTISDNIKMWDNSIDDSTMIAAADAAQIHKEIAERHGAYSGEATEHGNNFSGGQRQRIEIATALAKEPTILILDEATSALDSKTESLVMEHIRNLGITLVMIAHRLSTIRHCDCIYVMEHGRVIQQGTHDELINEEGLYQKLNKYA